MSREDFNNFITAAERSPALKKKLKTCKDLKSIIQLAKRYGFLIRDEDIAEDDKATKIFEWFKTSKISPINQRIFP